MLGLIQQLTNRKVLQVYTFELIKQTQFNWLYYNQLPTLNI